MELEQMLEHTPIRATDSGAYNTIDTYAQDTVPLYGSNVFDKPIGGIGSGVSLGSPRNIRRTVDWCQPQIQQQITWRCTHHKVI